MSNENQRKMKRLLPLQYKKGTVLDLLFIPVMLFIFAIIALIMLPVISQINENLNSSGMPAEQLVVTQKMEANYPKLVDGIFLFILVGLSIAALVGAMFINSHPIFYFVIALLLLFFSVINAVFANAFQGVAESPIISDYAGNFLIITFVMQNFPFVILVVSFIIMIVLLAKGGGQ